MDVSVVCSNPHEMRLAVTIDYTLPVWGKILELINGPGAISCYGPLADLRAAVSAGISQVKSRAVLLNDGVL